MSGEGIEPHHLPVTKSARYFTLGEPHASLRQLWFGCHGYRQSAERFLGHLRVLRDPSRLLVAPEGLSRFYVKPGEGLHGEADHVGASWMTREDRDAEIRDYVEYLEALDARITSEIAEASGGSGSGAPVPLRVVLGFSQGVHTAVRWVVHGTIRPRCLVLWGAYLPNDLDMDVAAPILRDLRLVLVRGLEDPHVDDALHAREEKRLEDLEIPFQAMTFDGGHRLDSDVLKRLAEEVGAQR